MCTSCENLRVRREKYTKKKLKEAREEIATLKENLKRTQAYARYLAEIRERI
jgi:hypothetical protein